MGNVKQDNRSMLYSVTDKPPWYLCVMFGVQVSFHIFITFLEYGGIDL